MGKNKNKQKVNQAPSTSEPANDVSISKSNNKEELRTLKKSRWGIIIGLALLILVSLVIIALFLQPWNASEGEKLMRYNGDYVLCYNSSKYYVHAGDTVNVINDNQILLDDDTVCIPDDLEIYTDSSLYEPEHVKIIGNENGSKCIYKYTLGKKKPLLVITNDSVPLNAVDGEMFEISQKKDEDHDRPLFVLGSHVIWPNYGITNSKDTLKLAGHEPIVPSIFKVFGDTLIVKFERTDSIYNVGIYPEYDNKLIANVVTDGKVSKVYIGDAIYSVYRLCTKDHISCLIQPTNAEIIEIPNPVPNGKSQLILLMIISIIAFVEFIVILVAATIYFVKKNDNKDEEQDGESPQSIEQKVQREKERDPKEIKDNFNNPVDAMEQNNDAKDLSEQENQAEEVNDRIEKLEAQLTEKTQENQTLKDSLNEAEKKIEEVKSQAEDEIKNVTSNAEKQIKTAQEKAQSDIDKAKAYAKKAEEESRKTEERVTKKYEGIIKTMEEDIQNKSEKIQMLSKDLLATRDTLKTTSEELSFANDTIVAKEKALDRFNKTITDISPAKEYADSLEQLLVIGEKVEKAAIELGQNKDIDDYLINKYIARYRAALSVIDMQMFTTDVLNATKAQFVYKGQMLATFDQKDKKTFYESMKLYFYDTYIKKYVDALVVLNETMVGMQYLADGATAKDIKPFETYRKEIDTILKAIEIEVISVKIMDSCADNLSLIVVPKVLDFDCPKNSICQINNCIVYLKGASKPNEKIQVIVKK